MVEQIYLTVEENHPAANKKENGKPLFLGLPVFQVKEFLAIFTIS